MTDRTAATVRQTIPQVVDTVSGTADRDAVVFPGARTSYAELADRSLRLAGALRALGVGPGDTVGLLQHGGVDLLAALVGTMRLGAVAVPVNARYQGRRARVPRRRRPAPGAAGGSRVHRGDRRGAALARGRRPGAAGARRGAGLRQVVATSGEPLAGMWSRARLDALERDHDAVARLQAETAPDDLAMLLYTSGTTARPKGCMHSHGTLLHVAESLAGARFRLTADDRFWSPLPLFHVGGIDTFLCALVAGCTFVHPGLFEPGVAVRQLAEERCTVAFPAFETIWLAVLDHPDFAQADLDALRLVVNVGVPARLRAMQERLPTAVQVSAVA